MKFTDISHSTPAYLVLGVGILAVSSASILIRISQQEATSLVIAAYRLTIASLVLLPITVSRNGIELRSLKGKQLARLIAAGGFLALHFATWITSLEWTTVASSVVLVSTTPLWVALASPIFLKEKISRGVWLGLGLSLLGSLVVGLSSNCSIEAGRLTCDLGVHFWSGRSLLGNTLALIGGMCAAGYLVIGRQARPSLSLPVYIFCVYGAAALGLLAIALVSGANFIGFNSGNGFQFFSLPVWLCLIGLALGPQLLGHSAYNWALRYLPAASVSVALLGEPIGTTILAFFLLRETPSWIELAGGALILAGIFITSRASPE
ncbi:predicted permease, DMT superfamily [Longilinea arvoryzae]|uniref:Predicted permease, DMT superfamily n=1 Tax=Longilinea arvoryzae TaxID=360412 RepID=A0A0S7BM29_9CHLR|nr:DMT family transporter [Longilinea arvoryzae]GAP15009.1 predicted permease, DMT superfamily [Longilinea arvoryzae]